MVVDTKAAPPAHRPEFPAWTSLGAWVLLSVVTVVGLAFDLGTKSAAFRWVADVPVEIERARVVELTRDGQGIHTLLPAHEPRTVLEHILEFQLVLNKGAVFGLGAGKRWVFIVFTLAAIGIGVWAFGRWTKARDRVAHVSIGLVFAGGLGNMYDRLMFACVRDFLHPLPGVRLPFGWHWPNAASGEVWPWVSNVADLFLILGVTGLMISMWGSPRAKASEGASTGGS